MASAKRKDPYLPSGLKFLFGGLAGMAATCVVQPLDLLKTRMQLTGRGRSSYTVAKVIYDCEGFLAFYHGISAGLLRQACYTTTRLGVYNYFFDAYRKDHSGTNPDFTLKLAMGIIAGAIGAFFGNPADVALVRMTADGLLPQEQRRNYKHVFNALIRIINEEGIIKLWRGATPTVVRAMVVNSFQLGTYSQAREILLIYMPAGIVVQFWAAMASGLITSIASLPVDIIKTRIQNAARGKSQVFVVSSLIRGEGVLSLWKGFLPYYARSGPHTVLTFIFLEQLSTAYFKKGQ